VFKTAALLAIGAVLCAASVSPAGAGAKAIKAIGDLHDACTSKDPSNLPLMACVVYLGGVEDTMKVVRAAASDRSLMLQERIPLMPFTICDAPNIGVLRQAFISWSEKNPNKWQESPAAIGVWETVRANWPCKVETLDPPAR
jgi:Rap1a immunity proteins